MLIRQIGEAATRAAHAVISALYGNLSAIAGVADVYYTPPEHMHASIYFHEKMDGRGRSGDDSMPLHENHVFNKH